MRKHILENLSAARVALDALLRDEGALEAIAAAARVLVKTLRSGGRVYSCGNGGSMADAMHFAEELSGRFRSDRGALGAMAISDPTHLTCVGNDFGFDQVFARFVEAHARAGDALLAISTSGNSANVIAAAKVAREKGAHVLALTGRQGSKLLTHADVAIVTPAATAFADRVQELHIKVIHSLIELCERELFPENYRE